MNLSSGQGSGDERGAPRASLPVSVPNPEGTQSEREEALWCHVVLLKEKISRLEKDVALRDELINLLRQQKQMKAAKPAKHPALLIPKGWHKCGKPDCDVLIPRTRLYCCRAHSAQRRWELRKLEAMEVRHVETDL